VRAGISRAVTLAGVTWSLLLASLCSHAHHSFSAEFDIAKPVELTGAVTEIEWTNPHAWVHLEVKDKDGNSARWAVEFLGVNSLVRSGFNPRTVKAGDVLTVTGYGARNGTNTANASSAKRTETGEMLWSSSGPPE
jgi:uncharacterized protein DUF6152